MHANVEVYLLLTIVTLVTSSELHLLAPPKADEAQCNAVKKEDRLDCFPKGKVTQESCVARGCCWAEGSSIEPSCYYQPKSVSYTFKNIKKRSDGVEAQLERTTSSPYPRDVKKLKFTATFQNDNVLRVKITDASKTRYETPYPKIELPNPSAKSPLYSLNINKDNQGFTIVRISDGTVIFDASDMANFIYSDLFIQISTKLPSDNIYGLGEHKERFKLNSMWSTYTMFNRDAAPSSNINLYGSHPFYMVLEKPSQAHGVFLKNSNGMDVILQPSPALTFRTIGGILDFYIFLGPTPSDVLKQYQEVIGKPKMPPYWSLGFHLCKYGIGNLDRLKSVLQRNLDAGIPIETQWNDLDYMNINNDFTYSSENYSGLPEFVQKLHEDGRRYVILFDPGVSSAEKKGQYPPYEKGIEMDIFVKDKSGKVLDAKVWNLVSTVYPDFTNPKTYDYWFALMKDFHDVVPFDGAWIDMNEPSNFYDGSKDGCPNDELENPPYVPNILDGRLMAKTVCMTAKQSAGVHYDVHNLYGISEAQVTSRALEKVLGERSLIISRSTFPGSGVYGGHWSGDIFSTWEDLRYSIPQLLDFSLFGIPLMGADICGFNHETNEDLCNRWMQLGAFYPFSRNHNSIDMKDQDPVAMGELVVRSSVKALQTRYTLLPYLYTLFWRANQDGSTVARPLMIEFPEDSKTYDIDTSFLWGSALLIAPVLEENNPSSIKTYLPKGVWYDFYTGSSTVSKGEEIDVKTDKETIPLFIRGGQVIPMQYFLNTTEEVRNSPYKLLVALDENGSASGEFYWDDGISVDVGDDYTLLSFQVEKGTLTIRVLNQGSQPLPKLDSIKVYDTKKKTATVIQDFSYLKQKNHMEGPDSILLSERTVNIQEEESQTKLKYKV